MATFTINSNYSVWETKGLAPDRAGRLAISENNHEQGSVHPESELVYLGKKVEGFEGVHCFKLPDGRMVKGHKNHFDKGTKYNSGKLATRAKEGATPPAPQTVAERKELAQTRIAELQATMAQLEEQEAQDREAEAEIEVDLLSESAAAEG